MLSRQAILIAAVVLAVCSGPVTAQWEAFFSDPAGPPVPVDYIWALPGEPFALDIYGGGVIVPEPLLMVFGYSLDFTWTAL